MTGLGPDAIDPATVLNGVTADDVDRMVEGFKALASAKFAAFTMPKGPARDAVIDAQAEDARRSLNRLTVSGVVLLADVALYLGRVSGDFLLNAQIREAAEKGAEQ